MARVRNNQGHRAKDTKCIYATLFRARTTRKNVRGILTKRGKL